MMKKRYIAASVSLALSAGVSAQDVSDKKEVKVPVEICAAIPLACLIKGNSNGGGTEPPIVKDSNGGGTEPPTKPNKN